jgi:phage-related protein
VRYEQVNAMLLNEFLKEHKVVLEEQRKAQEQADTIAELKSGMKTLAATVKQEAAQIQRVSAQLELQKPPAQSIVNKGRGD